MKTPPPQISLIINTFDNPRALARILDAVSQGTQKPCEVVVADDGSQPATREMLDARRPALPFALHHCWQEKKGYRRSRILNLAIAQSRGDYLVFQDGDCIPHPRFVEDHAALARTGSFVQGRRAFVMEEAVPDFLEGRRSLGALMLRGKVSGMFKTLRLPLPLVSTDRALEGILGCNLAIWREDLVAVNGYDEAYEGWGAEDSDLAARLYHLGRNRRLVHGRALLFHLNHPRLSRTRYADNKRILEATLREKKVRCQCGLDTHPAAPSAR